MFNNFLFVFADFILSKQDIRKFQDRHNGSLKLT